MRISKVSFTFGVKVYRILIISRKVRMSLKNSSKGDKHYSSRRRIRRKKNSKLWAMKNRNRTTKSKNFYSRHN